MEGSTGFRYVDTKMVLMSTNSAAASASASTISSVANRFVKSEPAARDAPPDHSPTESFRVSMADAAALRDSNADSGAAEHQQPEMLNHAEDQSTVERQQVEHEAVLVAA